MQSIKKFFPSKNEPHQSDTIVTKTDSSLNLNCKNKSDKQKDAKSTRKSAKKKYEKKLSTIVYQDVEDITNLICDSNGNVDCETVHNNTSGVDSSTHIESNGFGSSQSIHNIPSEKSDQAVSDSSNKTITCNEENTPITVKDISPQNRKIGGTDNLIKDPCPSELFNQRLETELIIASGNAEKIETTPLKTPTRSRRFSFNIKSPKSRGSGQSGELEKKMLSCSDNLFDEAFNIVPNQLYDVDKENPEAEITHPNKRFKSASTSSGNETPTTTERLLTFKLSKLN